MILYDSMERILYHQLWVVGGCLVKKLKIGEKLSGLLTLYLSKKSRKNPS